VIGWVDADGELTLSELTERLAAEHGVAVHHTSLSRLLKAAGFTVKKNSAGERNRSR
jgi:transposase